MQETIKATGNYSSRYLGDRSTRRSPVFQRSTIYECCIIEHYQLLIMAECLSRVGGGNSSPENVRRWTENLSNVLGSPTARLRFRNYLILRELENEQALLEFWEICSRFLLDASTRAADNPENLKMAQEIVQFAKENISFDAEMNPLNYAIASGDIKNIVEAVSDAKKISADKLKDKGYPEFCRYLLKEAGLLRDGN
ncbi:uncharacterized protein LOC111868798 isoform X1 [Cryptotermes secundus]|uniref:uncharacterized protein LOC111868798 isoform X1 n=1 Tax=Cryptotermes secundus TaxID=105785 RepID=UPI001454D93E|nr:uncharacterized protein LOC111868798 isoform X1 [Cryptotermes secundus]